MFETDVAGSKEWTRGFLREADVRCLEDFDCEMRFHLQKERKSTKVKSYDQMVEQHGDKVPTHCQHGVPLNKTCVECHTIY
jgi:hypothetical protein